MKLVDQLVDLIRETSSSLPEDVLKALKSAAAKEEKGSSASVVLKTVLDNCKLAKKTGLPLCQDTGTLTFFVDERLRRRVTPALLKQAVAKATALGCLRKNCIDSLSGKSYDDNCAEGAPVVHYVEAPGAGHARHGQRPTVTLILKGGGSENMSRQYSLPDASLGAGRDLAGVRKCVLDAVQKIQGYGCAPGILGVCIGGDRATGYEVAKEQLLRPLDEAEADSCCTRQECRVPFGGGAPHDGEVPRDGERKGDATFLSREIKERESTFPGGSESTLLGELESTLLKKANSLGIGPMGLGGRTTLLGVKVAARPRVPASFFVTVAYMCWACRRRTLCVAEGNARSEK